MHIYDLFPIFSQVNLYPSKVLKLENSNTLLLYFFPEEKFIIALIPIQ